MLWGNLTFFHNVINMKSPFLAGVNSSRRWALPGADIGLDLRSEKTIQSDKKQFILVRNGSFKYEPIQSHTNQLGPTPYGSVPHKTLQSNMKTLG